MTHAQFDWSLLRTRGDVPRLLNHMGATHVCEVGVKAGGFFETLLIGSVEVAIAIDVWDGFQGKSQNDTSQTKEALLAIYGFFCKRHEGDKRVVVIKKPSSEAHKEIQDESLDFVYLDADHTYESVLADINNFYLKIKKGGVLAGHDYLNYVFRGTQFGVVCAVNEFVFKHKLPLHITNERKFKSYFIPKPPT